MPKHWQPTGKRLQPGFTLIELLVVMAILVLLSVISYRALLSALNSRQMVDNYSENLREFELGLFLLKKDLKQVQFVPLPSGTRAFVSDFGDGAQSSGEVFALIRAPDAYLLRGVARVSYHLQDGKLWQQVGQINHDSVFRTALLSDIESLAVSDGQRLHVWQQERPPDVVTLTLHHKRYGKVEIKERINGQ